MRTLSDTGFFTFQSSRWRVLMCMLRDGWSRGSKNNGWVRTSSIWVSFVKRIAAYRPAPLGIALEHPLDHFGDTAVAQVS
jgi:hypothetical protein